MSEYNKNIQEFIDSVYRKVKPNMKGHVATYIPQLAEADSGMFGICFVTCDGTIYEAGETSKTIPIESISKVFTAAMVADELGIDVMDDAIGNMGSSLSFNSVIGAVLTPTHTVNPFVNQGAIATTSLFYQKDKTAFRNKILSNMDKYAGRKLAFNESVYKSEGKANSTNMALAYLLKSYERFYGDVDDTVDVYTAQCSVNVSTKDLATMACVFANDGVHPYSGKRIISEETSTYIYRALRGEGLYEYSAKWDTDVGAVSAKSGAGGGIIIIIKGVGGISIVSPPLDKIGNSVRGIQAGTMLARKFNPIFNANARSCKNKKTRHRRKKNKKTRRR